jgi:hypothetical protein
MKAISPSTILMENMSIIQIMSMFSIGAYNAVEIGIITFYTIKNYRSLYFLEHAGRIVGHPCECDNCHHSFHISSIQSPDMSRFHDRMVRYAH